MSVSVYHLIYKMQSVGQAQSYAWNQPGPRPNSRKLMVKCLELYRLTSDLLEELISYGNFSAVWPRVRCWMPLQFRLCAEQVMWDWGGEWRKYVSGFKPIESVPLGPETKNKAYLERLADRFSDVDGRGIGSTIATSRTQELERRRVASSRRIGRKA